MLQSHASLNPKLLSKPAAIIDLTCFSDIESERNSSESCSLLSELSSNSSNHSDSEMAAVNYLTRKAVHTAPSNGSLDTQARYTHPTFPDPFFFTALTQPERFKDYIDESFPSILANPPATSDTDTAPTSFLSQPSSDALPLSPSEEEPLRMAVNATVANSVLLSHYQIPTCYGSMLWIVQTLFPDNVLPKPFNDQLLDGIDILWNNSLQTFTSSPQKLTEAAVMNWLNHLANSLGIMHDLIKPTQTTDSEGTAQSDNVTGFVIDEVEDRAFSHCTHNQAPSGGYRIRKPDLCLVDRAVHWILHKLKKRPRWQHVQAVVEVSTSASRESMIQQILEKSALMLEAQPFRRFTISLAFRLGEKKATEFCVILVDRAGVCQTSWMNLWGYEAVGLCRVVYALAFASPEVIGVDTTMTVDPVSGDVTQIQVDGQQFQVIKEIYSSLVIFGRGTRVFLVKDSWDNYHILKDAWILRSHPVSEVDILKHVGQKLRDDPIEGRHAGVHPRFVAGNDILHDSTARWRGHLQMQPPERLHRRVVTGPVGDPISSFRSREEFIQVMIDCIDCKVFVLSFFVHISHSF